MPKVAKATMAFQAAPNPYPHANTVPTQQRAAAIWSATDDEILLHARSSGLNWQPIASRHFPNKTPNACRKRHERLIERRHVEDWDARKLEALAEEYMNVRKEMWEALASRLGERWTVVEAKCMEKGLKTLQSVSRQAQRKAAAENGHSDHERGILDHTSDSGIGLGSDAEMEVEGDVSAGPSRRPSYTGPNHAASGPALAHERSPYEHIRSQSLPQPLPLYQPPMPVTQQRRTLDGALVTTSPQNMSFGSYQPRAVQRCSPESQRSAISIQSMLAPAEPQ